MIEAAGLADLTMHSNRRDSPTFTSIIRLFGWLLISTFRGGAGKRENTIKRYIVKFSGFLYGDFLMQEEKYKCWNIAKYWQLLAVIYIHILMI